MREIYTNAKVVWAWSNNHKDTALATEVDPKKVKEVGSMAEVHKDTALTRRLPAQSSSTTTHMSLMMRAQDTLGMFLLNGDLRVTVKPAPTAEGRIAASPQLASTGHRSQPCKTCHDLCLDQCLDYDSKMLRTSLSDVERSAEQGCPSCAVLRDGVALCKPDFRTSEPPTEHLSRIGMVIILTKCINVARV
jgi:hypothetical protein